MSVWRRVRRHGDGDISGHFPAGWSPDPKQHHYERLRYRVLSPVRNRDADRRIGLSYVPSDKYDFLFVIIGIDAKWCLIHVVEMLDHVVDAPIAVPSNRRLCHEESGGGIPHELLDSHEIMTILVVDQFFVDTLEFLLSVCARGVHADGETREKEQYGRHAVYDVFR